MNHDDDDRFGPHKTKAILTENDEIVVTMPISSIGAAFDYLKDHREQPGDHQSYYLQTRDSTLVKEKNPNHYVEPVEVKQDYFETIAVFKNEAGDTKTVPDPRYRYHNYGSQNKQKHPDDKSFELVGYAKVLKTVKSNIRFPFHVTRTKAYFTHKRKVEDARDEIARLNSDLDPKEVMPEWDDMEDDDFLMFRHESSYGTPSRWLNEQLSLNIVI